MSRADRVAERIKFEVNEIITKKISDPRIGFITITKVSVSPDLKNAKIFVSIFEETKEAKADTLKGLVSAERFIKGLLGDRLNLRLVPTISFIEDDSIEKASRLWNLMKTVK